VGLKMVKVNGTNITKGQGKKGEGNRRECLTDDKLIQEKGKIG
jgi:hypothetical protein